jgi:SAM-dependent methyltransferase
MMVTVVKHENLGQAAFTKKSLSLYDSMVLGLICHLIWRCPNDRVLAQYQKHLSANHLEVGVGTGYFLDHAEFPTRQPRVALLDLNQNCLDRTAQRIARYAPEVYHANVLAPIHINAGKFDSVCLNYVLHCLPGSLPDKGVVFANLKALLNPGGVIFGATVLQDGAHGNMPATMLMRFLNSRQLFSNERDNLNSLVQALEQHLTDVHVDVVGCVALFKGNAGNGK